MIRNVLFVHQSAEMYGSDKVLLSLVTNIDRNRFNPIVLLPWEGPLLDALKREGICCYVIPMVRVERSMFSIKGLLKLPFAFIKSIRAINKIINDSKISVVHSNTLAVLSGALWSAINRVPHVWHVHEIIERPWIVRKVFALLLRLFADRIICNSYATLNLLLKDQAVLEARSVVVWNGLSREQPYDEASAMSFRENLGLSSSDVLIALLGRINRWKGQLLLVSAAEILEQKGVDNLRYVIVGGTYEGQEHYFDNLMERINSSRARKSISVLPFSADIWSIWDACDIAVVPSTEPEPFGMVALEAMISSKPVIAADHGGLSEIVVHGETGLLVTPNDATELASAIEVLAKNRRLQHDMGAKAKELVKKQFSVEAYVSGVSAAYEEVSR